MHTIRSLLASATLLQAWACAAAPPRELVHPFPPGGPTEVIGAARASRTLRAMQRYASPAFTDTLAAHVANTLQGQGADRVIVTRRHRRGGARRGTPHSVRRATVAALSRVADADDARNLLLDYGVRLKYFAAP